MRNAVARRCPTIRVAPFSLLAATLSFLLATACAPARQHPDGIDAGEPPSLEARLTEAGLDGAKVGFLVSDLDSGAPRAASNPDIAFIPASTLKVATAYAALETIGHGHRFQTTVYARGNLQRDGILQGDIWLKGGGDPLLSVQDILALAQQLRDHGIEQLRGRFFYDDRALIAAPHIAAGQPRAAPYNPAISALSLDFNRLSLHWRRDGANRLDLYMAPVTGTGPPRLGDTRAPPGQAFLPVRDLAGGETWRVDGEQLSEPEGSEALPVRDPAARTAAVFRALAGRLGLQLPPAEPGTAAADSRPMAALISAPLIDTLRPALRHSNNLVSELIGRAVSQRLSGRALDGEASASAVAKWLAARISDTDWRAAKLLNHSGLSAASRVTPRQMNAVMTAALKSRYGGWSFAAVLPVGGWDGALDGRFSTPATSGRVWAKSGTMHYAKGLTGLLFTAGGGRMVFALYVTDFERRGAYDADPDRLAPASQADARAWIKRAEGFMEDLVDAWIAGL